MGRKRTLRFSQDDLHRMDTLLNAGKTYREIAQQYGCSRASIVHAVYAHRKGFTNPLHYLDFRAQSKGFSSHKDYKQITYLFRHPDARPNTQSRLRISQQDVFEKSLSLEGLPSASFDFQSPHHYRDASRLTDLSLVLRDALTELESSHPDYFSVLSRIYFKGEKLKGIGSELNITFQGVSHLKRKGLAFLKESLLRRGIHDWSPKRDP